MLFKKSSKDGDCDRCAAFNEACPVALPPSLPSSLLLHFRMLILKSFGLSMALFDGLPCEVFKHPFLPHLAPFLADLGPVQVPLGWKNDLALSRARHPKLRSSSPFSPMQPPTLSSCKSSKLPHHTPMTPYFAVPRGERAPPPHSNVG